jgi:hypothetical protein
VGRAAIGPEPHIRLLQSLHPRVEREHLIVHDGSDSNAVHVATGVEGMTLDIVWRRAEVEGVPIEEHDAHVETAVTCRDDTLAETPEVSLVEPGQVEFRLAIAGRARPGSDPGLGAHAHVELAAGDLRLEVLPSPQADEVVTVFDQEIQVSPVVERFWTRRTFRAWAGAVEEIVVEVCTGQVHDLLGVARSDGEVARIDGGDHQRPGGGSRVAGTGGCSGAGR